MKAWGEARREAEEQREMEQLQPSLPPGEASEGHAWLRELGASHDSASGRSCLPFWLGSSTGEGTPSATIYPFSAVAFSLTAPPTPRRSLWLVPALRVLPGALSWTALLEPSKEAETSRCAEGEQAGMQAKEFPLLSLPKPGTFLRRQCPAVGSTLRTKRY